MNKAEFKEKRKKLLEQRVRPTEGTEAVSAWDYDFNDSNEVLQSGEVELLENMTSIVPEDRPKTGEIFKEKRNNGWTSILTCVQTASSPNRNLWNVAKA